MSTRGTSSKLPKYVNIFFVISTYIFGTFNEPRGKTKKKDEKNKHEFYSKVSINFFISYEKNNW